MEIVLTAFGFLIFAYAWQCAYRFGAEPEVMRRYYVDDPVQYNVVVVLAVMTFPVSLLFLLAGIVARGTATP